MQGFIVLILLLLKTQHIFRLHGEFLTLPQVNEVTKSNCKVSERREQIFIFQASCIFASVLKPLLGLDDIWRSPGMKWGYSELWLRTGVVLRGAVWWQVI